MDLPPTEAGGLPGFRMRFRSALRVQPVGARPPATRRPELDRLEHRPRCMARRLGYAVLLSEDAGADVVNAGLFRRPVARRLAN